jgi:alkylhydroperoxidase family enzyme
MNKPVTPPKPQVLVEAQPFIPYMREEDFATAQAGGRSLQEAHGLSAQCAQALRLPAGDRRDAVALKQQYHARSIVHARPAAQAQARRGRLRDQRLRLLYGAQLLDAEKAARRRFRGLGRKRGGIARIITGDAEPKNEFERVCFDYVRAASEDPTSVPDELLQRLKEHLTPAQIVELACVVGFWKFYNAVHDSLHIPVESQLLQDTGYVNL